VFLRQSTEVIIPAHLLPTFQHKTTRKFLSRGSTLRRPSKIRATHLRPTPNIKTNKKNRIRVFYFPNDAQKNIRRNTRDPGDTPVIKVSTWTNPSSDRIATERCTKNIRSNWSFNVFWRFLMKLFFRSW